VEMPVSASTLSAADEELKTGDGALDKGISNSTSQGGRSVGFFDAAASESGRNNVDMEVDLGPNIKVLSPTRTQSTVMQTTGVEIIFHELSLTATYTSKNLARKTRKILKNISGITRRGTCSALMGPSGCGKTSLLHTLAGKNDKSKVRACLVCDAAVCVCGGEEWKRGYETTLIHAAPTLTGSQPTNAMTRLTSLTPLCPPPPPPTPNPTTDLGPHPGGRKAARGGLQRQDRLRGAGRPADGHHDGAGEPHVLRAAPPPRVDPHEGEGVPRRGHDRAAGPVEVRQLQDRHGHDPRRLGRRAEALLHRHGAWEMGHGG
jgi:energy-coupling factor transporter ATP-binding protein EcfA2